MKPDCGWWRTVSWLGALGLALVLGCETRVFAPPPLPPPPPPAPAPSPQVSRPTLYVAANRLNLRACPGMDCPKISVLDRNEEVEKVGQAEDWAQVRVKRDGRLGWVNSRYLSEQPLPAAPEAAPPPLPGPPPLVTPPPPLPEVPPPAKPPLAEKAGPPPKKKAEERPAKPKPAEAAEPAPRKPTPAAEKAAPKEEKPAPPGEKPAAPEPTPESPKRIRIM